MREIPSPFGHNALGGALSAKMQIIVITIILVTIGLAAALYDTVRRWIFEPYFKDAEKFNASQNRMFREAQECNIAKYSELDGFGFEDAIQSLYTKLGYQAEATPRTRDGGWDLSVRDDSGLVLIECKAFNGQKVGRPILQKLHSAMVTQGAAGGICIATSGFSSMAVEFAAQHGIQLIDLADLSELHRTAYGDTPDTSALARLQCLCPKCGKTFGFVPLEKVTLSCPSGHEVSSPIAEIVSDHYRKLFADIRRSAIQNSRRSSG